MYRELYIGEDRIITNDLKDSGAIGEFTTAPYLLPNFVACDGITEYEKNGKHAMLYAIYTIKCPSMLLAGSDENHFKIIDLTGRYVKLDKNGNGSLGNESLPNVKGYCHTQGANQWDYPSGGGALFNGTKPTPNLGGGNWTKLYDVNYDELDLSKGQTNADGTTFKSQEDSTYKNGAKVNPDHILMIPQVRYRVDKVDISFCPYEIGDIYQTTSSINPSTRWVGTTWERIGTGNYIRFVGDGEESGQELGEELPTPTILSGGTHQHFAKGYWTIATGSVGQARARNQVPQDPKEAMTHFTDGEHTHTFDTTGIYKDGGEVRPKSITAYGWIRVA